MSKLPKPEKLEEADLRSKSMSQVLQALQGRAVFAKQLAPTHVYRQNHTCNGPTLPRQFVEENMARIRRAVVILTRKAWPMRLSVVHWERGFPDVVFCGGWRVFAAANNFVEDDQIVFHLFAPSQFDVYIFNPDGSPKPEAGMSPMYKLPVRKERKPSVNGYSAPGTPIRKHLDCIVEESKPSVLKEYFAAEEIIQAILIEDLEERNPESRKRESEFPSNKDRRRGLQHRHPSFFKRLTLTNFRDNTLEIPGMFSKTYGDRLQSPVKLQGVSEASAVYSLTCRSNRTLSRPKQPRVFLGGCGWRDFRDENMLEVQQYLRFSLVSDSYFVVRDCPR